MSELVPVVPGRGNTISRPNPAKRWSFTLNNYTEMEYSELKEILGSKGSYIMGREVGEQGTPHIQGYVNFHEKCRPLSVCKNKRIHWEKCKGTEDDNIKYCSKDNNYETNIKIKRPVKVLEESQLYDWQKKVIQIICSEPDDRKIFWFWEPKGCAGKTTFCKYLALKFGAIPIEGKKNDILYCAAEHESEIYIFDFERSMEDFISYAAMEKIKNGFYMCAKYESKPIIRNCPHVLCFANFRPDKKMLSADRWVIRNISNPI